MECLFPNNTSFGQVDKKVARTMAIPCLYSTERHSSLDLILVEYLVSNSELQMGPW